MLAVGVVEIAAGILVAVRPHIGGWVVAAWLTGILLNYLVVVIGGGWIGLGVAPAAISLGHGVTVVEPRPMVLRAALGDELGAGFADHHRRHGVRLLLGTGRTIDPSALADPDVALDDLVPKAEAI